MSLITSSLFHYVAREPPLQAMKRAAEKGLPLSALSLVKYPVAKWPTTHYHPWYSKLTLDHGNRDQQCPVTWCRAEVRYPKTPADETPGLEVFSTGNIPEGLDVLIPSIMQLRLGKTEQPQGGGG